MDAVEAASLPCPVVFKSFAKKAKFDLPTLVFTYFSIQFHNSEKGNEYFLLVSDSDPSRPIRLYKSGMLKLKKQLEYAFKEAQKLMTKKVFSDLDCYDCGIINCYDKLTLRVVITTYKGQVNIWLRLYTLNEKNEILPTKTAVRFSTLDNLKNLENFIENPLENFINFEENIDVDSFKAN